MLNAYFEHVNIWAVLVSGLSYFMVGSVWFSGLFGKTWAAELEKHGVKIERPGSGKIVAMMVATLVFNMITAAGVSLLVFVVGTATVLAGLKLGLFAGLCFAATSMFTAYNWESRSTKLSLIDVGYPLVGIVICAIILSLWH